MWRPFAELPRILSIVIKIGTSRSTLGLCGRQMAKSSGASVWGLDITERKRNEEQALYQATHDALTGLANYGEFATALEREVKRADRSNHPFAVLLWTSTI